MDSIQDLNNTSINLDDFFLINKNLIAIKLDIHINYQEKINCKIFLKIFIEQNNDNKNL